MSWLLTACIAMLLNTPLSAVSPRVCVSVLICRMESLVERSHSCPSGGSRSTVVGSASARSKEVPIIFFVEVKHAVSSSLRALETNKWKRGVLDTRGRFLLKRMGVATCFCQARRGDHVILPIFVVCTYKHKKKGHVCPYYLPYRTTTPRQVGKLPSFFTRKCHVPEIAAACSCCGSHTFPTYRGPPHPPPPPPPLPPRSSCGYGVFAKNSVGLGFLYSVSQPAKKKQYSSTLPARQSRFGGQLFRI